MYKHIFFDLDGTLWDFTTNTKDTIRDIYNSYKLTERIGDFEVWYARYRQHNLRLWEQYGVGEVSKEYLRDTRFYLALKDFGIDDVEMGKEYGRKFVEQSPLRTTLFPHTHEVLSYLHGKYKLHIVTNGFSEIQHIKIRNTDIEKYFENMYTVEKTGYLKPHKGMYHYAVSSLNAKKDQCIMIGDDFISDVLGAKDYGIDQVFFRHNETAYDYTPTYEIRSLDELLKLL